MRALMWVGIVAAVAVSVLIACVPGPVPAEPLVHSPFDSAAILHACDEQGICCYWSRGNIISISCVATKIIVIVSPGEVKDEREGQSSPSIKGEISNRYPEERFLLHNRFPRIGTIIREDAPGVH